MKMVKKLMMCGLIVSISMGIIGCSEQSGGEAKVEATQKPEEASAGKVVIATVNGEEVYLTELEEAFNDAKQQYEMQYGPAGDSLDSQKVTLLDPIIDKTIIYQKIDELGLEGNMEEAEASYAELVEMYGEETVEEMIKTIGFTPEEYKEELKNEQAVVKLQEIMQEGEVSVTEEDIKNYYEENIQYFTTGAGGDMEHILVKLMDKDTDEHKKEAEEAVKTIEKELAEGKTFEELKAKYGADDVNKDIYIVENLGFRQYEEPNFDPAFLAGAKQVKEGEVSKGVKSSFGYHFIQVKNIKEETVAPLEEVKDIIKSTLENIQKNEYYINKLEAWKNESEIVKFEDRIQ